MGNVLVKEETLTQIADAIREKSGTNGLYKPGEMPEAILEISIYSGEGADPTKPIRFYDPYGNLAYSYSIREFSELEELPPLPEIQGLTGEEWNWTREGILAMDGEVEVGSLYITDDGETRIYIELVEGALSPKLGFKQERANSIWIDWGDGSAMDCPDEYGDEMVSIEHQYEAPGNYMICIIPDDDAKFTFVGDAYSTKILHKTTDYNNGNRVYGNTIKKIELGRGITEFTGRCFNSMSLESVTIPAGITVFNTAFQDCYALKVVTFPKGVVSLPSYALRDTRQIKRILFAENGVKMLGSACDSCHSLEHLIIPNNMPLSSSSLFSDGLSLKRVILPKTITEITAEMFHGCEQLKSVTIKGELTKLGFSVFYDCYMLEHINLPESLCELGSGTFFNCRSLKKISLSNRVENIVGSLFHNCYSLHEMTIGENVKTIGTNAFSNCSGIEHYYIKALVPPTLSNINTFSGISPTCKMHVPKGCLEAYQTAEYWSEYADHMVEMEE